jgi:hypothetical protein
VNDFTVFPTAASPYAGSRIDEHPLMQTPKLKAAFKKFVDGNSDPLDELCLDLFEHSRCTVDLNLPNVGSTHVDNDGSLVTIITVDPKFCAEFETEEEGVPVALAWYCGSIEPVYDAKDISPLSGLVDFIEIEREKADNNTIVIVAEDDIFEVIRQGASWDFFGTCDIWEYGYKNDGDQEWFNEAAAVPFGTIIFLSETYVTAENFKLALEHDVYVIGSSPLASIKRALAK